MYFQEEGEEYPLFKYFKEDEDYQELIDLLLNSTYTLSDIAKMLDIGYSTVKKINAGTMRKGLYPNYSIRKKTAYQQRTDNIIDFLLNSEYSFEEIAALLNCSKSTVVRVNHKKENLVYPLRNL